MPLVKKVESKADQVVLYLEEVSVIWANIMIKGAMAWQLLFLFTGFITVLTIQSCCSCIPATFADLEKCQPTVVHL